MAGLMDLLPMLQQSLGGADLGEEIVATGSRKKMAPPPPQAIPSGDMRTVPSDPTFQPPERKSNVVGAKGTLRNILGVLGDAFLIQAGRKPMYAPKREQEKLSDAYLESYGMNPEEGEQRVAVEDPDFSYKMRRDRLGDEYKTDQLESMDANRKAMAELNQARLDQQKALADARLAAQQEMKQADMNLRRELAAMRKPAARAPARVSTIERIRDKVEAQGYDSLTEGQKRVYDDSVPAKKASRVNRTGTAPAASGGFRIVKTRPVGVPMAE